MRIRYAAAAATFAILAGTGVAQAAVAEVEIAIAPPADRVVVAPPPRVGYIYERPHYAWDGKAYVWSEGRFIEERKGHVYEQPMLVQRGKVYIFRKGHWDDD